jgi:hypothetical protein
MLQKISLRKAGFDRFVRKDSYIEIMVIPGLNEFSLKKFPDRLDIELS